MTEPCYIEYGDMMIDYIRKTSDNLLQVAKEHALEYHDTTFQKYVNAILKKQLTDLGSRERVTGNALGFSAKIPIFIDESHLFICIRSYRVERSLYINYHAISSYRYEKGDLIITFHTHHELKIKEKYAFRSQLEKCVMIMRFLE